MHVSTTHVLRKFAQKMAGQTKQANPLTALADPRVLGTLGGAAVGGLGAYGLARLTQSEDDKEKGNTPWLAPMLGAAAGAAGGYYGAPHLSAMLQSLGKKEPNMGNLEGVENPAQLTEQLTSFKNHMPPKYSGPNAVMPLSMAPRGNKPQTAAELTDAYGEEPTGPDLMKFTDGQPDKAQLSAMGLGSR